MVLEIPSGILFHLFTKLTVKIVDDELSFIFLGTFLFYFHFSFSLFSIFRTTWVRVDWSRCHISHNLMVKSQD